MITVQGSLQRRDPIGLAGGMKLYAYANNNPLRYTDPKGTNPVCIGVIACGAAIQGGINAYQSYQAGASFSQTVASFAVGATSGAVATAVSGSAAFSGGAIGRGVTVLGFTNQVGQVAGNLVGAVGGTTATSGIPQSIARP